MAYRGHQQAITSLLAACGLGGAGYGAHKYIKYSQIPLKSVTTSLQDATSTNAVPAFTAIPEPSTYAMDTNPSEDEVLIEVENPPFVPPVTAFRKQSFVGPLSLPAIIVGVVSLFLPAVRNVGVLGWVICGLPMLVTLYMVFQSRITKYLSKWPSVQDASEINTETQPDGKDVQIASLKSDLHAAQAVVAAIHQVVDPDFTSPDTKVLDLVRDLEKSRMLSNNQHRESLSRSEKNIVSEKVNLEQLGNRIRMLENSNIRLKGDLKQSETEISRLIEKIKTDKTNYKHKKDHYKAVAHYVVSAHDVAKTTEQDTEDSLQKRLREIMVDHNERLLECQRDNESLRTQLAHAKKHREGMSQKLAKFDQETIQQTKAIEAEVKRLRENENAQLLRTQKLEDASAERERKLRDQLERVQNDRMTEVDGFGNQIQALREEMRTLEDEKNAALGDLQQHTQGFERSLSDAMQMKDGAITSAKIEIEALKSALTKANAELQKHIQGLEADWSRKLEDKEIQLQEEKSKHDRFVAFIKSKVRKEPQGAQSKKLREEKHEPEEQPPDSDIARPGALPQEDHADNEGSHPQEMEIVEAVESQLTPPQTNSPAARPEPDIVLAETRSPYNETKQTHRQHSLERGVNDTGEEEARSPENAPGSPKYAPHPPANESLAPRVQDVPIVDDSTSNLLQERPSTFKIQEDETRREDAGSSFSPRRRSMVDLVSSTPNQTIFTVPSISIPGLHPTKLQADSAQSLPAPDLSDSTQPPPILLDFHPVEFTASVLATPQPSALTEQAPHDTGAYQFTSTPPAQPSLFDTLAQGRRSTEAEIGARRKLQPRRRNQTINDVRQATPRSQSMSSALRFDPQALAAAMAPAPVAPTQPDALELYDKADALAKIFTVQAGFSGTHALNSTPARSNIFEGKTFDLNVPPPSTADPGAVGVGSSNTQSTISDGKDDVEDNVDWGDE